MLLNVANSENLILMMHFALLYAVCTKMYEKFYENGFACADIFSRFIFSLGNYLFVGTLSKSVIYIEHKE